MHAELALSYRRASLADVYVASAALVPPCLVRLAYRGDEAALHQVRARLATEQMSPTGLAGVLRRELAFHGAVVDALDSQTFVLLKDMLHEVIERVASRLGCRSRPIVRCLGNAPTHQEIVNLVEAGDGRAAATLARQRAKEIEAFICENDVAGTGLNR
jgi:DNA-binding GntR family transcriptional regulator